MSGPAGSSATLSTLVGGEPLAAPVPAPAGTDVSRDLGVPSPGRRLRRQLRRHPALVRTKLWAKRLLGREPWLRASPLPGLADFHGWSVWSPGLKPGDVVYSAGIGSTVAFELDLIRHFGVEVHAFDPTPATRRWLEDSFPDPDLYFHPWAVADRDATLQLFARRGRDAFGAGTMLSVVDDGTGSAVAVPARRLVSILGDLGHQDLALLKLDIEGAEYGVLADLLAGPLRPRQILVEFHHRFPGIGPGATTRAVAALGAAGYRLAALSLHGREACFVRAAPEGPA